MRFVPVDTSRLDAVFVDCVPKTDQAGVQKIDRDGVLVWALRVMARWADTTERPEVIEVAVSSRTNMADNLTPYTPIELQGLKVFPWSQGDRSGLAFSADGARTKQPSRNGGKPAEAAAAGATSA